MRENSIVITEQSVTKHVELITKKGVEYATALLSLVPDLSVIKPNDRAVCFDVGSGADLVALKMLGFKNVEWLNEPEPLYLAYLSDYYRKDELARAAIIKATQLECAHSNLNLQGWLQTPKFSPKLVTMLAMAPQYLRDSHVSAKFLRNFAAFAAQLSEESTIVLSAGDDHIHGERAFSLAHDFFLQQQIPSQLFLKNQNPDNDWTMLGDYVLVLKGIGNGHSTLSSAT